MASLVNLVSERRKNRPVRSHREAADADSDDKPSEPGKRQGRLTMKDGRLGVASQEDHTSQSQREALKKVHFETKTLLPGLLATRPDVSNDGVLYKNHEITALDRSKCPRLSTKIVVTNHDTIDAAIFLDKSKASIHGPTCVLNMANAKSAGGGWSKGALAQEEAMCYRSSLSFTLKYRHYPLPDKGGIYSPTVLVFRHGLDKNHKFADLRQPDKLHVISAVSVAAIACPSLNKDKNGNEIYRYPADRQLMEAKMRAILRIAAMNGRRRLVLGAFGCGAFANPKREVASMWKAVLGEKEFQGWWEDVMFAVLDTGAKDGTFEIFRKQLDGMLV